MKVRSIGVKICDRMQAELFMKLAMRTGEILLVNGAEIYRVEDTVSRILATSDDIDEVEVASTYSSIMISFYYEGYVTSIKKIKDRTINLDKISKTNDFTRNFVNNGLDLSEADKILDEIESVSYTHLDVYKRQLVSIPLIEILISFGLLLLLSLIHI